MSLQPPAPNAHPFIRWIFFEMQRQGVDREELMKRSGLHKAAEAHWRLGHSIPKLPDIEAVINALGYKIVITKKKESEP